MYKVNVPLKIKKRKKEKEITLENERPSRNHRSCLLRSVKNGIYRYKYKRYNGERVKKNLCKGGMLN